MRVHTSISLRSARATLTWMVHQAEQHGRSFVITLHGRPAAAVVPLATLQLADAGNRKRTRKLAQLLREAAALMPGAARASESVRRGRRRTRASARAS